MTHCTVIGVIDLHYVLLASVNKHGEQSAFTFFAFLVPVLTSYNLSVSGMDYCNDIALFEIIMSFWPFFRNPRR